MRIIGIDPGVTGALAVIEFNAKEATGADDRKARPVLISIHDLPTLTWKMSKRTAKRLDPIALNRLFDEVGEADRIVVERLSGGPGITASSSYSMGWTAGIIDAVINGRGLSYLLASPSTWKRGLNVPADKAASRRRATAIFGHDWGWPQAQHHNRAEAAMIALWGAFTK